MVPLLAGVQPALLKPLVNVLRLSLHPGGLSSRIANLPEWRGHLLERLRRQVETTADPVLVDLLGELKGYPAPRAAGPAHLPPDYAGVVVPLQLATEAGLLSFFSTTTVFGTPVEITLAELALEAFFPADRQTAEIIHGMAAK